MRQLDSWEERGFTLREHLQRRLGKCIRNTWECRYTVSLWHSLPVKIYQKVTLSSSRVLCTNTSRLNKTNQLASELWLKWLQASPRREAQRLWKMFSPSRLPLIGYFDCNTTLAQPGWVECKLKGNFGAAVKTKRTLSCREPVVSAPSFILSNTTTKCWQVLSEKLQERDFNPAPHLGSTPYLVTSHCVTDLWKNA